MFITIFVFFQWYVYCYFLSQNTVFFQSNFKAELLNFRMNSLKNAYGMKIYMQMSDVYMLLADPLGVSSKVGKWG